jgi:predicted phage terminase large subunit-like protein
MQNDPVVRGGNMLNTDCIQRHETLDEYPKNIIYYRVWDLAHTAKQRMKDDPDYTSGTLLGFSEIDGRLHLWIKDVARMRLAAPERDREICATSETDGAFIKIAVEDFVDAKDTYFTFCNIFKGRRVILPVRPKGDKVVRATPLEAIFKAGNVHVPKNAPWLQNWISEVAAFPNGAHDDQVDNMSAGYTLINQSSGFSMGGLSGV